MIPKDKLQEEQDKYKAEELEQHIKQAEKEIDQYLREGHNGAQYHMGHINERLRPKFEIGIRRIYGKGGWKVELAYIPVDFKDPDGAKTWVLNID